MTLLKSLLFFVLPAAVFAVSGDPNHKPSIMDLMYPAVNFLLVFGFIIFKVKKPVAEAFTKNSKDVEALYSLAEEKYKEAQIRYDAYAKKLEQLDSEISRINDSSEEDVKTYTKLAKEETEQTLKRMERDAENKLETDKNQMIMKLNKDLLDKVIDQAKSSISSNKEYQKKATSKLVSRIS